MRILYGLDRFSEDLDFSLLAPDPAFRIDRYASQLEEEIAAFGFKVHIERIGKSVTTAVESAFLKADTVRELLVIEAGQDIARQIPKGRVLKIKLEVDTDPPAGFATQTRYLLRPIPFAVRVYVLPDLFAGKMHALLCRRWKNRVKGRDWYDLVWYAANHPELNLPHLEKRMRQSGHWKGEASLPPMRSVPPSTRSSTPLTWRRRVGKCPPSSRTRSRWPSGPGSSSTMLREGSGFRQPRNRTVRVDDRSYSN